MYITEAVSVAVPATSANLGPGYDAFGLALNLEDEVTARITSGGFRVDVTGEGEGEVARGELSDPGEHLILATMIRTFDRIGVPTPDGLTLTCLNRIPHARGLGSSSAAIVAGIILARALAGKFTEPVGGSATPDDADAVRLAAEIEGHPDNVAPCLLGGFTIAWTGSDGARAVRLDPAPGVRPVVLVPSTRGVTARARAALPATVAHADAAFNAARTALFVHALTVDPSFLFEATEDRLHQAYRAPGMPETAQLVSALRSDGVPAMVSGAGPSVIVLLTDDSPPLPEVPNGWCARSLSVSVGGARILVARHAEGDPVAAGLPS